MTTPHICETCNKEFKNARGLTSHKSRKTPCKNIQAGGIQSNSGELCSKEFGLIKPFLKWVGGKTQIIDQVINLFPPEFTNYYEPFLGGGSVLLAILSNPKIRIHGKIIASDVNSNLIGLYLNVQSRVEELIADVGTLVAEFAQCAKNAGHEVVGVRGFAEEISEVQRKESRKSNQGDQVNRKPANIKEAMTSQESYYFWIRSRFNAMSRNERQSVKASAMLLFMNKTGFRGVYREGPHGINVPFGNYKNPTILDAEHIRLVSRIIQPVVFICRDFREALSGVEPGDFVYMDPPYAPENEKSFVSYTAYGFDKDTHTALFAICNELAAKNIGMLMSNADLGIVREAFIDETKYEVRTISCRRAINSTNPEARTNEVLIRSL